jgi:y4mF family transcriptional regulator
MGKSKKTLLIVFVKTRRKSLGLTQVELAKRAGVGLRFVRNLEQGKNDLRMDKVNDVLALFGHELGPVKSGGETMSEQDASDAGE